MSDFVFKSTSRIGKAIYLVTPFRNLRRIFFRAFCRIVSGKTINVELDKITYALDLSEKIDVAIYFGRFEPDMRSAIDRYAKVGQNILDIGANIGAHTLRFAKILNGNGHVYAFEPSNYAMNKLKKNISLNSFRNISCYQVALSDVNQSACSFTGRSSWKTDGGRSDETTIVDFKRLDDWWAEHDSVHVDLIKIDTDGNEFGVFAGGQRMIGTCHPIILMEVVWKHFQEAATNPLLLLERHGYRYYDIRSDNQYDSIAEISKLFPEQDHAMTMSMNIVAIAN